MLNMYATEKLRELDQEFRARQRAFRLPAPSRKPVVGPLARATGHAIRRLGEGLEAWGAPPPRSNATAR